MIANISTNVYSYVYDAQSGSLDHIFVSPSLYSQITGATVWHINADEPAALDYHAGNPASLYDPGPYRSSDHDPVIVGLDLEPISIELSLFRAQFENERVRLEWRTQSEINIAGFYILRSQAYDGAFVKITNNLIVSKGDSGRGAEYIYSDENGSPFDYYKLESISLDGQTESYGPIAVSFLGDVESKVVPKKFDLFANYPNPFNPSTMIRFEVPATAHVKIRLYDVTGRLVRTLLDETRDAGTFEVEWDGRNGVGDCVPAGLYFCKMTAGDFTGVQRMLLVK